MVALAVVLACALVAGAARAGMRFPAEEALPGIGGSTPLDYSAFRPTIAPLSDAFIRKTFGLEPRATPPRSDSGPLPGATVFPDQPARAVVEHALTNDDFEDAYPVARVPFTAKTDASNASRQGEGEPDECAAVGERTVWYRYTSPRDTGLIANTIGTGQATTLGVFTGSSLGSLTPVADACHSSVQGNAYVPFAAGRGVTYFFQVTEVASGGPLVFNLDPVGTNALVSTGADEQPDSTSQFPAMSGDGRYVAFYSAASNLVPNDRNGVEDVFVRNLVTDTTERVSVSSQGVEGNGDSKPVRMGVSDDGRLVAFSSLASNLVDGDTNDWWDVFVHDRRTHETIRVSVSSEGRQGAAPILNPDRVWGPTAASLDDLYAAPQSVSMSADGRFIAFDSDLSGLTDDDQSDLEGPVYSGFDVFVHDRLTGTTTLVSKSSSGENGNCCSDSPAISADGSYVAFVSGASNLVPLSPGEADDHGQGLWLHTYGHDLRSGRTERLSVAWDDAGPGDGFSYAPTVSGDGRFVAFSSFAENLAPDDGNGLIDVFVRDRRRGTTEIVSLSFSGEQGTAPESEERLRNNEPKPAISRDGRFVTFHTEASLVAGDTGESLVIADGTPFCFTLLNEDVYLRDRRSGTTTLVSVGPDGRKANGPSFNPVISADGQRIVFVSYATDLASGDAQSPVPYTCVHAADVFVHTFPVLR